MSEEQFTANPGPDPFFDGKTMKQLVAMVRESWERETELATKIQYMEKTDRRAQAVEWALRICPSDAGTVIDQASQLVVWVDSQS